MSVKVHWLDLFPNEWAVVPAKRLFTESKIRAEITDEQLTASQEYGVIPQKEFIRRAGRSVVQINQHLDKRKRVEKDDFVISMRSFQGGLERAWASGGIRSSYVVLKPSPAVDVGYFARLFKSQQYIQALQATAHFIRDGQDLSFQNFTLVDLPLPPLDEQTQIAKFLDYETANIDALIAKQQQLIALLQEKRQAVISHTVTKGLNPAAPLRDSGVEWLGQVPAHWVTAKLDFRYEILLGKMLNTSKVSGQHLGRYLRNTHVQWDQISEEDLPEMDFLPHERERYSIRKGDLIVCEGGEVGRCAIWDKDYSCFYQKALHRLRPRYIDKDVPRFMYYHLFLAVAQERFVAESENATIAHLPAEAFRQYRFTFPSYEEQQSIANELDRKTEKFDDLENKAREVIELLHERRTALISAAVTGKIDVRGWQPPPAATAGRNP